MSQKTEHTGTYTIRVSKGTALIPETRSLLREWHPGNIG